MLLVSRLVIVGLVQSSVVLINYGAAAHTLDWYEDDDLEGVRFNYKIQEDLAQDGQALQYSPFTSSRWQSPVDISSQSSAQTPGGTFAVVREPTVSRSQSVSSSSTVADANNINKALGVAFRKVPSFKNSISKYDSKYDSKEDKNSFHTIHKSITSSSPTMSVSIVRRVGSYEPVPFDPFNHFGLSRSVSFSNTKNIVNTPAPFTSLFSQNLNIQPVKKENDDSSEKHNIFRKEKYLRDSEEKEISTPVRAKVIPTLAFLRPVTAPRPVANLRYQLRQQLSTTEKATTTFATTTQAPIIATYNPIFNVEDNTEVKSSHTQAKASEENNENSNENVSFAFTRSKQPTESPQIKSLEEDKEDSKESSRTASTRSKHPAEGLFDGLLKRQSKPLSRFRYLHVLALSGEDD